MHAQDLLQAALYLPRMSKGAFVVRAVFRGIARTSRTYTLDLAAFRATGVPALLVAVSGVVIAGGIAALLARGASRLPETLAEARGLADSLLGNRPRLQS